MKRVVKFKQIYEIIESCLILGSRIVLSPYLLVNAVNEAQKGDFNITASLLIAGIVILFGKKMDIDNAVNVIAKAFHKKPTKK